MACAWSRQRAALAGGRRLAALSLTLIGAAVIGTAATAAPAQAATFSCRASISAVRPSSVLPASEPFVANRPGTPCATDTAGATGAQGGPSLTAGPAAAYTYSAPTIDASGAPAAPAASALVSVDGANVTAGTSTIGLTGPAQTQVSYRCVNGSPVAAARSTLDVATVNGQTVDLASRAGEQTISLGGGSYVTFNQTVQTATSLTQRLIFAHVEGVGDQVVGEVTVGLDGGNPCRAGSGSGGGAGRAGGRPPSSVSACPPGSTLVPGDNECEIIVSGRARAFVSRPFDGPSGGRVMTLAQARRRYRSACLYGRGPGFAIIGTNRADRIIGTRRADRILSLGGNDRVAGRGGSDCIDAGAGKDRVVGGNGNDRVYGGPGSDRIVLGNGNDRVWGGAGNDRIRVGTGRDHMFSGPGNDRMFGPGRVVYASCGRGHDLVYVNKLGIRYARAHGCRAVRRIRTQTQ